MNRSLPHRQQGVVLIIGLLFLILLTLLAISAFNFGKADFMATHNMQMRHEMVRSTEQVLDELLLNTDTNLVSAAAAAGVFGTGLNANGKSVRTVDINGDGVADVRVTIDTPTCTQVQSVKTSELNLQNANDLGCLRSVDQTALGVQGASSGESLCSETVWEVQATATDAAGLSPASATVVQGLGMRMATTKVAGSCL